MGKSRGWWLRVVGMAAVAFAASLVLVRVGMLAARRDEAPELDPPVSPIALAVAPASTVPSNAGPTIEVSEAEVLETFSSFRSQPADMANGRERRIWSSDAVPNVVIETMGDSTNLYGASIAFEATGGWNDTVAAASVLVFLQNLGFENAVFQQLRAQRRVVGRTMTLAFSEMPGGRIAVIAAKPNDAP